MSTKPLRHFLEIPYEELEELNMEVKRERLERVPMGTVQEKRLKYLGQEGRIKAVTVCFSDVEGRFHMLDYDKKFLLKAANHLTFDGSSIRGFTAQSESDLRLKIDWRAFWWLPSDIFGPGKVIVFGEVCNRDGSPYEADMRSRLHDYCEQLYARDQTRADVAAEIEGFLFKGLESERLFWQTRQFDFISSGGYFHSMPQDPLRQFMDRAAETQRAMAFGNEKDHPEVAPSQFEMNFAFSEALVTADQIQLYKLLCRQIAQSMDMTASFLPKPVAGINGNGMHTNISLTRRNKNVFYDEAGEDGLSQEAWAFTERLLHSANDLCLVLNPSVNSYRRLDPAFEAPNQIKASAVNRAAMIRIPLANERSARIEVRSISPDVNPYMLVYALLKTGLEGPLPDAEEQEGKRPRTRFLQNNIHDALRLFRSSELTTGLFGESCKTKYAEMKQMSADRCPKELGSRVKTEEIVFHHEVTNQLLWSQF